MARIKDGIYLEMKKGTIGTGSTAKETEYRDFWLTIDQDETSVYCALLDQNFNLTSIREIIAAREFETKRFTFIPQGEKRYQRLIRVIREKEAARSARPQKPTQNSSPEPKASIWWEGPKKEIQPGDLFKREENPAGKTATEVSSGNWWEGPKKDLKPGDIFKTTERARKPKSGLKSKTSGSLKKSWWDK